jgi:hypothetical protein
VTPGVFYFQLPVAPADLAAVAVGFVFCAPIGTPTVLGTIVFGLRAEKPIAIF